MSLRIPLIVLDVASLILHTVGIYALAKVYARSAHKEQRLFIGNLSVCEISLNLLMMIQDMQLIIIPQTDHYNKLIMYLELVIVIGINISFYCTMIFIALDRFAIFVLKTAYHQRWNAFKAKLLLGLTWLVAITLTIIFCLVFHFTGQNYERYFVKYVHPTLDFVFLFIAVMTYASIFIIFRRSSQKMGKDLTKSSFLCPSLLILTFILFIIIPDLIQLSYQIKNARMPRALALLCLFLYRVSPIADVGLYIFLLPDVRTFLRDKMTSCRMKVFTAGRSRLMRNQDVCSIWLVRNYIVKNLIGILRK